MHPFPAKSGTRVGARRAVLWSHQKRGFYHDGRFATLGDVVNHYNAFKRLGLSSAEQADLVKNLLSL